MLTVGKATPRALGALMKQLGAPGVASRLSKEELCLALGALEKLGKYFPAPGRAEKDGGSAPALSMPHVLQTRTLQYIPLCSPREIGMMAGGCQLLRPDSFDLIDRLIEQLHLAAVQGQPLSLLEVTQVMEAALSHCRQPPNLTLRHLVVDTCPALLASSPPTPAVLDHFLSQANTYLCRMTDAPVVAEWYNRVRSACQDKPSLASVVASRASLVSPLKEVLIGTVSKDASGVTADTGVDAREAQKARQAFFAMLADTDGRSMPKSASAVTEALEGLALYQWRDPVAQDALLDMALSVVRDGQPAEVERVKRAALLTNGAFLRLFDSAGASAPSPTGSSRLTTTTAASRAYHLLVTDRVDVPADLLHAVQEEHKTADATAASLENEAMRIHVLQRCGSLSLNTLDAAVQRLQGASPPQSLSELVAAVRSARCDDTTLVANALEPHLRGVLPALSAWMEGASAQTLLSLADALSLPVPRGTRFSRDLMTTMASLTSAVSSSLLQRAEAQTTALLDTVALLQRFHALPASAVFTTEHRASACQTVLDRLCERLVSVTGAVLPPQDVCCALMRFFAETDTVHEPLIDLITRRFEHLVTVVTRQVGADVATSQDELELLQLAVCQMHLDTPEFYHSAWQLVRSVANRNDELSHVSAAVVSAALALTIPSDGDEAPALLARLSQMALDTVPRAVQNLVIHVLVRAGIQHSLSPHLVKMAVTADATVPGRDSDDGVASLERVWLLSCVASSAEATVDPVSVVDAALPHIRFCAPHLFCRLSRQVAHVASSRAECAWAAPLVDALVNSLPQQLNYLSFSQIAECVFSLAQTQHAGQRLSHQVMANAVADYTVNAADELLWSGRDIARLLRGLSLFHHTDRAVFAVCTARLRIRPVAATLDQPSAALLFGALGDVRFVDEALFNRLSRAFTRHAADLNAADLLLSVRAHSRVLLRNDEFYEAMGHELVRHREGYSVSAVLELLAAYATVEQPHDVLADALSERLVQALPTLDVNTVTRALVSLWLMDMDVSRNTHAQALIASVVQRASELTGESLVKLCSIVRDLRWRHVPLLEAIAQRSAALGDTGAHSTLAAAQCRIVLDTLGMFLIHAPDTRRLLSSSARTVSKESPAVVQENSRSPHIGA